MKKILYVLIAICCCMCLQVGQVHAYEEDYTVTMHEEVRKRTLPEELYYRIFEKDTKDFFDYVLLGAAWVALIIVMVFQNTHTYIVMVPIPEEKSDVKEEPPLQVVEPEEIEEPKEEVPQKPKRGRKKKSE